MNIKVIKTKEEYEKALDLIEILLDKNPKEGTTDAHKLELLLLLIKDYEAIEFPTDPPDPIEAIEFRMEQQELSPRDLIPCIGSRSKVSEVLSRKRPLTLSMIRALNSGLGIPLESLVSSQTSDKTIDWNKFPINEMEKRGWVKTTSRDSEKIIQRFFHPLGKNWEPAVLYRKTDNIRSVKAMDKYSLMVWNAQVVLKANKINIKNKYKQEVVTSDFMREVVKLSRDRKSTRLNSSHIPLFRMPSSA